MKLKVVQGDLLNQDVEVIVNAWNRNIIPWWLLVPQGISGAIKRRAGLQPFRELARKGAIPLGGAVETGPGKLSFRSIIHVAGISIFWRASERSIRDSVRNALTLAQSRGYHSIAFPVIGSGTGGYHQEQALNIMQDEASRLDFTGEVRFVKYVPVARTADRSDCYCRYWAVKPALFEAEGIPRGYCGICEKCGRPGHCRDFPGLLPFDRSLCDFHYRLVGFTHPFGFPGILFYLAALAGVLFVLAFKIGTR